MLPSLGPAVAAWPFAGRAVAYTLLWTCHAMLLQFAVSGLGWLLMRAGVLKKLTKDAQVSRPWMYLVEIQGYASELVGMGLAHVSHDDVIARGR
jgi:hypothetical protein